MVLLLLLVHFVPMFGRGRDRPTKHPVQKELTYVTKRLTFPSGVGGAELRSRLLLLH